MKFRFLTFIGILFTIISLSGCGKKADTQLEQTITQSRCMDYCQEEALRACNDFETEWCKQVCNDEWTDKTLVCIQKLDSCEQLKKDTAFCVNDPNYETKETEEKYVGEATCESACTKYVDCARYGDDETEQDLVDAYDTCMIECKNWSEETLKCMAPVQIKEAQDCMPLTMCGLKQYEGVINKL
ncbi:MAG: hypothetical protein V1848_00065 [Candidatus Magasanikbacteria bacterium]